MSRKTIEPTVQHIGPGTMLMRLHPESLAMRMTRKLIPQLRREIRADVKAGSMSKEAAKPGRAGFISGKEKRL